MTAEVLGEDPTLVPGTDPMLLICPSCKKKLNVPEAARGKKVRCPGCQKGVAVPAAEEEPAPAARREPAPAPRPEAARPAFRSSRRAAEPEDEHEDEHEAEAPNRSKMRCASCKAAALEALPANAFSRHPGYVCTECQAVMRPPGSTGTYVLAIILGVVPVTLAVILWLATSGTGRGGVRVQGSVGLVGLGVAVIVWAGYQLRLPVPLDAPARPSRLGLILVVLLVAALILGGGLFGFFYYLHEMM